MKRISFENLNPKKHNKIFDCMRDCIESEKEYFKNGIKMSFSYVCLFIRFVFIRQKIFNIKNFINRI
jgi:hypothetical protein